MAYQENTSVASINQLLAQLKTFLLSDGWLVDNEDNVSFSPFLEVHKGTVGIRLQFATPTLSIIAKKVGGASAPAALCNNLDGAFNSVWFFSDAVKNYCHVVVTKGNGEYIHFSFGWVDNLGYSTRTWYGSGQRWSLVNPNLTNQAGNSPALLGNYSIVVPSGVLNTAFAPAGDILTSTTRKILDLNRLEGGSTFPFEGTISPTFGLLDYVVDLTNSSTTGGVHLHSIPIVTVQNTFDHLLGLAPDVRLCNISDLTDSQEITNSGETWKIFPMRRRGIRSSLSGGESPILETNSLSLGFAYKKV